jgi:hypothetical protein
MTLPVPLITSQIIWLLQNHFQHMAFILGAIFISGWYKKLTWARILGQEWKRSAGFPNLNCVPSLGSTVIGEILIFSEVKIQYRYKNFGVWVNRVFFPVSDVTSSKDFLELSII